jgi:hypothetical protein
LREHELPGRSRSHSPHRLHRPRRSYSRSPEYDDGPRRRRPSPERRHRRSPEYDDPEHRRRRYDDDYDRPYERDRRRRPEYSDEYYPRRRPSYDRYERERPSHRGSRSPHYVSPSRRSERVPVSEYEAADRPVTRIYSPSGRRTPPTEVHVLPSRPSTRPRPEYFEGDMGGRPPTGSPTRVRTHAESPTRVYVHSRRESPPHTVVLPTRPPTTRPVVGPEGQVMTGVPTVHHVPTSTAPRPSHAPPTIVPVSHSERSASPSLLDEGAHMYEPPITPSMHPVRPVSPGTGLMEHIRSERSDTAPIYPIQPPGHAPSHMPLEIPPSHMESEAEYGEVPAVVRPPRVPTAGIYEPGAPIPGDLHSLLTAQQERIEEQERRLEELSQLAREAEERRERSFREHEDERDRLFRENEERRQIENEELRDEAEQRLHDIPHGPPIEPPISELSVTEGALPTQPPHEGVITEPSIGPGITFEESIGEDSAFPVPPPGQPISGVDTSPQINEILELLRAQQAATEECKAADAERFASLREEIDAAREEAREECEARIRMLEDELARTKEELELERGQRRAEELERIEREHAEALERDEIVRNQLADITNIVQEQRDEFSRKREVADERWEEKLLRRDEKRGHQDEMHDILLRILQERELDRQERETERAESASKPGT